MKNNDKWFKRFVRLCDAASKKITPVYIEKPSTIDIGNEARKVVFDEIKRQQDLTGKKIGEE